MATELTFDGATFIPSKQAAQITGYAQDYIGQLARKGLIQARRVGGLWYVSLDSLKGYKEKADTVKPIPPAPRVREAEPETLISLDGVDYVSAPKAAELTGYHQDYVGQLAREGTILSRQVANRWYVSRDGIMGHKKSKDALLAAVQADSVGIVRNQTQTNVDESKANASSTFYTYKQERSHLVPIIGQEQDEIDLIESTKIPIHVLTKPKEEGAIDLRDSRDEDVSFRETTKNITFSAWLVLGAVIFVLGVLGSFLWLGFGASNREVTGSPDLHPKEVRTIEKMTSILEGFLIPEVIYRRGQ